MSTPQLAYLATPYTRFEGGPQRAFEQAAQLAGRLLVVGVKVYSPIVNGHAIAKHSGLDPLDHAVWLPFNQAMLERAEILLVAHMRGWKESEGVTYEIDFCRRAGTPIYDLDPQTLHMALRRGAGATVEFDPILGGVMS